MQIFDAHFHLRDNRLWPYHEIFLEAMIKTGIGGGIDCSSQPLDWDRSPRPLENLLLVTAYGIHPWYVDQATTENLNRLETLLKTHPMACIGEIGLDGIRVVDDKSVQKQSEVFVAQLNLARLYQRPVILHGARVWQKLFDTLLPFAHTLPAIIFHGVSFAPDLLKHPLFKICKTCYFSINMNLFNPHHKTLRRLLPHLPVERLLIETDAPDFLPYEAEPLIPQTHINHPKYLLTLKKHLETLLKTNILNTYPTFLSSFIK